LDWAGFSFTCFATSTGIILKGIDHEIGFADRFYQEKIASPSSTGQSAAP
jgi:hypothetical protein